MYVLYVWCGAWLHEHYLYVVMVKNVVNIALVLCPTLFHLFTSVPPTIIHHFLIYAVSFQFNSQWLVHCIMLTLAYFIISYGNTVFEFMLTFSGPQVDIKQGLYVILNGMASFGYLILQVCGIFV